MPKISKIKKPIWCPNASYFGYAKSTVAEGDVICFKTHHQDESYTETYGRVLGRANDDGLGNPLPKKPGHLVILVMSPTMTHAYIRFAAVEDVIEVRSPDQFRTFVKWFFNSKLPSFESLDKAVNYGAISASYIDEHLDVEGNLPEDWMERRYSRSMARLDADKSAKPLTRLVAHVNPGDCVGPGITKADAIEDIQTGKRTPL
ncbi:MAG TPA: hypothetical protein VIE65_12440 [Methylobacter sp.]